MDELFVEKIAVKEGAKDGRPWKRWGIKNALDNEWYSTFDEGLAGKLEEGKRYRMRYESKTFNGRITRDLKAIEAADTNGAAVPEAYSQQLPTGEANWDKVALGKTRCALWAQYLSGISGNLLALSAGDRKPDLGYLTRAGVVLVAAAEKDIFERPAGDDGVPF